MRRFKEVIRTGTRFKIPMGCDPHWTAYVSALLVPMVAALGAVIAYHQWRTAQNRLKLDLFDRRFSVFDAARTRTLIASVATRGNATDEELLKFLSGTREAKWLLNADIAEYLDKQLYRKALDLHCLDSELKGVSVGEERSKNVRKQLEVKD